MWGFPAARAQLVHPQGRLVLERGAARVKRERGVIVQKAAERGHVQVRETAQPPGEVGWVVAGPEDAAKLWVE